MISGLVVTIGGFILARAWPGRLYPWLAKAHPKFLAVVSTGFDRLSSAVPQLNWHIRPHHFIFNGNWIWFFSIITAIVFYLGLSAITYRTPFNLDRMLHRGIHAPPEERDIQSSLPKRISIKALLGITASFTRSDMFISMSLFIYRFGWFVAFVVIVIWNIIHPWPEHWWVNYSYIGYVALEFVVGVSVTIWFTWGSIVDLKKLFIHLKSVARNPLDDGTVVGHQNLDEAGIAALEARDRPAEKA
jgi:hypothetical protein